MGPVEPGTPAYRWLLAATVLGSGMAYLDSTVVNIALPALSEDLSTDLPGLQWVLDSYLVSLTALLLLGGALGDRYGRRRDVPCRRRRLRRVVGPVRSRPDHGHARGRPRGCRASPGPPHPGRAWPSLSTSIAEEDRARTVGAWAGSAALPAPAGPFIGGWLVDAASWRWAFLINLPIGAVAFVAVGPPRREP